MNVLATTLTTCDTLATTTKCLVYATSNSPYDETYQHENRYHDYRRQRCRFHLNKAIVIEVPMGEL